MNKKRFSFLTRQWSFALGGLFVGLAELLYFLNFRRFIPVTTGLAKMFSSVEANITHTHTVSRVYSADVHWIIIGGLFGAWLAGRLERQSRNWVKYSPKMLLLALLGGITFGFGTRLGPGCTTHHIFGGLSVMSVASWTIVIVGVPFAFITFELMSRFGLGPYFKHQENKASVDKARDLHVNGNTEACEKVGLHYDYKLVYNKRYNPWKDPLRMIAWSLVGIVILSALWTGFFGHAKQSLGSGPLWPNIARFIAGMLLCWGIAKAGVGTECGIMAPESIFVSEKHYNKLKIPYITRRMFKALLPTSGILAAIIVLNSGVLFNWVVFDWSVPDAAPKPAGWGLHIGHLLAAPCLAAGSVMMIGCEIRSYGRVGLGYLTGIVGLIGFYFGYLPYVYFAEEIDGFIASHTFTKITNIPQLVTTDPTGQKVVGVVYLLGLLTAFALVVWYGSRQLGTNAKGYLTKDTDELVFAQSDSQFGGDDQNEPEKTSTN